MKKLSKNLAMYILYFGIFVAVFCATALKAEAANVTEGTLGTNGGIDWTYDADTKTLTITGEDSGLRGTWDNDIRTYKSPFAAICEDVEIIKVQNCTLKGYSVAVFAYLESLKSIEFINVNTTNVTSMDYMFSNCSSLSSLNLSNFDTSNVTSMNSMFYGCSSLSSLNVSNFDTSKLTSMNRMFYNCSGLSSLDVSKFDTSKVTNMGYMFYGCSNLSSLDVSKFDTSNVTSMEYMFPNCSNLSSLDVSKFDTSNVKSMECMFSKCKSLSGLDVSKFDTSKVTSMTSMFFDCENLSSLDVSKFNTSNVTSMYQMFYNCKSLSSLDVSKFDTSNVKSMGGMFCDCENLSSLDVSKFNTSNVTSMYQMFYNCKNLSSLDLSSFDLMKVTSANDLFLNCTNLACIETPKTMPETLSIDLPTTYVDSKNEQTTKLTKDFCNTTLKNVDFLVSEITLNSSSLILHTEETGQLLATTSPGKALNQTLMWESSDTTVATVDANGKVTAVTEGTATITVTATDFWGTSVNASCDVTVVSSTSGYLGDNDGIYWTYDPDTKTLSITGKDSGFEGVWNSSKYKTMSPFVEHCDDVEVIKIENCTPIGEMTGVFAYLESLKRVEFKGFDTSQVTNMSDMFNNCSNLTDLDVSGFDTTNVTDMGYMFYGCKSLTDLDVSGFNTSCVTDMSGMFGFCEMLSSLGVSDFDTAEVISMTAMFQGCRNLTSLDLSNFNTANVEFMPAMFNMCESLISLDLSSFDLTKVKTMSSALQECGNLTIINTPKTMADNMPMELPGTFADLNQKRTTVINKDFANSTLINVNNLVTGVSVSPASAELKPGDTKHLQATVAPANAAVKAVTWKSSNTAVATVDANGKVTAVGSGTATITATSVDGSKKSASCIVTVTDPMSEQERQVRAFVERMYTVALGRASESSGINYWTEELLSHRKDGASISEGFIMSEEFVAKNYSNEEYLKVLYRTFFDREADKGGMSFWLEQMKAGRSRKSVLAGFVNSKEFTDICAAYGIDRGTMEDDATATGAGQFVERLYSIALERPSDPAGLKDWADRINNRTNTPEQVAKEFFLSPEYTAKNTSNDKYVETLYLVFMDRASESTGKAYWVGQLNQGMSRESVLEGFAQSEEFKEIMARYGL